MRERLTTEDEDAITPQTIVNIRPVAAALKEFFGSSQLSQFMDQTNSLAGLTHRRRLSALGAGGLTRERAPIEVRDVHPTHYGRMCPIETPEGPNIGLMGSLGSYAKVSEHGFVQTPYRKVVKGKITGDVEYLDAIQEEMFTIAQANAEVDKNSKLVSPVLCRTRDGVPVQVDASQVDYMDVDPAQIVSVATALIPFLEHNDANRALMGSNMQRQAVPLMVPEAPLVGTGLEYRAAVDTGDVTLAGRARQGRARRRRPDRRLDARRARRLRPGQVPPLEPGHDHPPEADRVRGPARLGGRGAGRRLLDRQGRARARQEPARRLHVLGGLQLRGRDHPERADREGRRPDLDPHPRVRGGRPLDEARRRGDHARHPEPLRGVAAQPRRVRDRAHRRRGRLRRPPGRQGHAEGRDRADRRGEADPGDLQGEGPRGARHVAQGASRRGRQGHRREDLRARRRRRPVARRERARARLRRDEAQDRRGRQARRPARQQGRDLQDRARGGHAAHGRRDARRHHPEPAGRALAHEHRPGARDPPRLGCPCTRARTATYQWIATPVFDGATPEEVDDELDRLAGRPTSRARSSSASTRRAPPAGAATARCSSSTAAAASRTTSR